MSSILPSGLPETVHNEEELARFIPSSRQFSKSQMVVKPAALMPNKKNGETSVFRHSKHPSAELWDLADQNIPDRTVYGAAIFRAEDVRKADLEIVSEEPPPRHANIISWPTDPDPGLQKAKQKETALRITQKSELVLR